MAEGTWKDGLIAEPDSQSRSQNARHGTCAAMSLDVIPSIPSAGGRDPARKIRLSDGGNARVGDK